MLTLIQNKFRSGERFPMLVDEHGVPDFWTTLFISVNRRNQTQSSITTCLHNINHLKKWEKINNTNIIEKFEECEVPGERFVESIKRHCGLTSEHIKKELNQSSKKNKINFSALKLAGSSPLSQVSTDYQRRRMCDICAFLVFVGREILRNKKNKTLLLKELEGLAKTIQANYPIARFNRFSKSEKRLGHAEKETFESFMEIFNLESDKNPFKNDDLKLRNYLLIQLLFWTGARSAEILSLTLDDIDYDLTSPIVKIKRRHDDPHDSRAYQPVTKTREREIIIPPELRNKIDEYIKIRHKLPLARKHPYLFVSHKGPSAGLPITNATFYNRVMLTAKAVDKDGFLLVKRHGFRHLFNERLSIRIDENNQVVNALITEAIAENLPLKVAELKKQLVNQQQETEMRMQLMGHSSAASARPYVERHIKRKAKRFHKEMMQEMSQLIKNAKGM